MSCIVCKKLRIPYDDSRSFHKFPKDDELKTKWMNAIGNFSVKKTSIICSDHFDVGSYHDTDGYTTLRRLLSTAVPRIISIKEELPDITNKFTDTSDKTVSENCDSTESHHNIKIEENEICQPEENEISQYEINTQTDSDCIINEESANLISQVTVNSSIVKSENTEAVYTYLSIGPLEPAKHTPYNDLKISHDEIINQQHHEDISDDSSDLLRKIPFKNKAEKKQIRYRCNFKTYRFARETFSSDEAWTDFQEFASFIKKKTATAAKKISRKEKKISKLKKVIEKLKSNNEINVAEYLQVIYRQSLD